MDLHICGLCKAHYTDLDTFLSHKQSKCGARTQPSITFTSFDNRNSPTNPQPSNAQNHLSINTNNLPLINDINGQDDYSLDDNVPQESEQLNISRDDSDLRNENTNASFGSLLNQQPITILENTQRDENSHGRMNSQFLKESSLNDIADINANPLAFPDPVSIITNADITRPDVQFATSPPGGQQLKAPESTENVNLLNILNGAINPGLTPTTDDPAIPVIPQNVLDSAAQRTSNILLTLKKGSNVAINAATEKSRMPARRIPCPHHRCNYSTLSQKDLNRHARTHTGEKPYVCTECKKSFGRSDKLIIHMRTHTGDKPYKCTICSYACAENGSLKKHMRIHTDERPYKCQLCAYASRNSNQLTVHLRTHTGDAPYQCRVCSAKFKINSDLKRHMRIHLGERPFKCDYCEHRSALKCNLRNHVKMVHEGNIDIACTVTGCAFKTSSKKLLWEHRKTHNVDDTFRCNVCYYQCTSKSTLKAHIRTHSSAKPFKCHLCSYATKHKGNLKTHTNTIHRNKYNSNKSQGTKGNANRGRRANRVAGVSSDKSQTAVIRLCTSSYKCTVASCNETFVREDSLRSHLRHHFETMTSMANSVQQQRCQGQSVEVRAEHVVGPDITVDDEFTGRRGNEESASNVGHRRKYQSRAVSEPMYSMGQTGTKEVECHVRVDNITECTDNRVGSAADTGVSDSVGRGFAESMENSTVAQGDCTVQNVYFNADQQLCYNDGAIIVGDKVAQTIFAVDPKTLPGAANVIRLVDHRGVENEPTFYVHAPENGRDTNDAGDMTHFGKSGEAISSGSASAGIHDAVVQNEHLASTGGDELIHASYQVCQVPQVLYSMLGTGDGGAMMPILAQQPDGTLAIVNQLYPDQQYVAVQPQIVDPALSYAPPSPANDTVAQITYRVSALDTDQQTQHYQRRGGMYALSADLSQTPLVNNQHIVYTLSVDAADRAAAANLTFDPSITVTAAGVSLEDGLTGNDAHSSAIAGEGTPSYPSTALNTNDSSNEQPSVTC